MKPYLVGIAGPSCSGKSLLARQLAVTYADRSSHVLSLDSYYRDLSDLEPDERRRQNFDVPDAIDLALFIDSPISSRSQINANGRVAYA